MAFILASKSPRRQALLRQIGLKDITIRPPEGEETMTSDMHPEQAARRLSAEKAKEVAGRSGEDDVIIAADTVVHINGQTLGKPVDRDDAFRMLSMLSGSTHEVYTGVTVIAGGKEKIGCEKTSVTFKKLSNEEISAYINTGDPFDKAGSYGIQGMSALFISGISGDFYNVMGLPLSLLYDMLKALDVDILRYCK